MKRIVIILITLFLFVPAVVIAADKPIEKSGCYEYRLVTSERGEVLIIDTIKQLTHDKDKIARDAKSVTDFCNDLGKSLHGRLIKLPDVSGVVIGPRQIAVTKYPLPKGWKNIEKEVVKIVDEVLCK